ncbi:MAG: hypothetical protein M1469_09290 [Bacteroidetes bacterium]|nr:hypothetical protein [Bacteroidota bacterium]MCL5268281.1 hypothetical protein [Bacteroidota bacterium]
MTKTKRLYRQYDPGWYLYRKLASEVDIEAKFRDDFIELVYVTLVAWNMNSRGARLSNWNTFKQSLYAQRDHFINLASFRLEQLSEAVMKDLFSEDVRELFFNLILVSDSKPRLVTCSKTLHFFLPNLFVPIDRKYTLSYFHKSTSVPASIEKQYDKFSNIQEECRRFANRVSLDEFADSIWNANIPKTIDNIIIGYQK